MSHFGLGAGKQKLEWHFENPYKKLKTEDSYIINVSFGHRPLIVLPNSISNFYNKYLRNFKKDHSASHAFMKLYVKYVDKDEKEEYMNVYVDFDGSIHVSSEEEYVRGDEKIIFEEQELDTEMHFCDFIETLLEDIPEYHLTKQNCKKFCEKVCMFLYGEDSFQHKYLRFLHRRREV